MDRWTNRRSVDNVCEGNSHSPTALIPFNIFKRILQLRIHFFSSLWCSFSEAESHFSSEIAPSVRAPMEFSRLFRRSCNKQRFRFKNSAENGQLPYLSSNTYLWGIDPSIPYTIETGYKTPFCPRENLSYMRLFLIWHDLVGRKNCLITELFLYGSFISGFTVFLSRTGCISLPTPFKLI